MKKAIKKKWLKLLRSGKIKQARGTLENRHGAMCCIGVLMAAQGVTPRKYFRKLQRIKTPADLDEACLRVYPARGFEAGLPPSAFHDLSIMNDVIIEADGVRSRAHSFKKIADWIEKNL
jgi:hypothetical protein